MTDTALDREEHDVADLAIDWSQYGRGPNRETFGLANEASLVALVGRIDKLINALESPKAEETLWSVEQIAQWLGLSKSTVELRVVTRPGFPSALRPVDSKQAQRRWFASDVMQWARSTAGTIPASRPGRRRKAV
ncbi:hypothetical protein PQR64_37895 [Paraburkholderia phytofirmans]|uniref:helix-turn-helix transcriptional regulator n=1 Tax=Paraburkholderia phytofirmans TaxID=261302 RepID=UPI0038B83873